MTTGEMHPSPCDQFATLMREEYLQHLRRTVQAAFDDREWAVPNALTRAMEAADKPTLIAMLRAATSAADPVEFAARFGVELDPWRDGISLVDDMSEERRLEAGRE